MADIIDSASEMESDTSSIDGAVTSMTSPGQVEQLEKRLESVQQENRVLKLEVETAKQKCKSLQEENRELRKASVNIQARAEQEEEYISNTLLKKINSLKKEKETLAMNYEQEEEFLTNDLSKKLIQLRQEKVELEQTLEKEQEYQVNKLMRKIKKLEADTSSKQTILEQLRREKIELENALEQEQESLVNRLWKRMDKLEAEKRMLQEKLDQPISAPPSPRDLNNGDTTNNLAQHLETLRAEVLSLKGLLREHEDRITQYAREEQHMHEENLRLQRKLQMELERRESLCRHLSESESSLEIDDERHFNEMSKQHDITSLGHSHAVRPRTVSSPIPYSGTIPTRPLSPGFSHVPAFSPPSPMRHSGSVLHSGPPLLPDTSPPTFSHVPVIQRPIAGPSNDKFIKPAAPPSPSSDHKNEKT